MRTRALVVREAEYTRVWLEINVISKTQAGNMFEGTALYRKPTKRDV